MNLSVMNLGPKDFGPIRLHSSLFSKIQVDIQQQML